MKELKKQLLYFSLIRNTYLYDLRFKILSTYIY
jgi:hypothetical protein